MSKTHLSSKYNFTVMSLATIHNASAENISVLWHNTSWISIMCEAFNHECPKYCQLKFRGTKKSSNFTWHSFGVTIRSSESDECCHRHYDTSKSFPFTSRQHFISFMTVLFLLRMQEITFVFHSGSSPETGYRKRGCIIHLLLKSIPAK